MNGNHVAEAGRLKGRLAISVLAEFAVETTPAGASRFVANRRYGRGLFLVFR